MNDLRFAVRQFLKSPGFTIVAVLTLALGIGGTTAMFSLINSILLKPLPFEEPGKLVRVWEAPNEFNNAFAPGALADMQRESKSFEGLSLFLQTEMNLTGAGEPARVAGLAVSANGLDVFRARPLLGRTFAPGEDKPGAEKVTVLTHKFWARQFGSDRALIGKQIRLNGEAYTVIGVLPPKFLEGHAADFIIPKGIHGEDLEQRGAHWMSAVGRLKPGVTIEQANLELNAIKKRSRDLYPHWKRDWGIRALPFQEDATKQAKPMLWLLFGAVSCVLLIACANVANLLLAKASGRRKEIAIRLALGAARGRIVRQLLTESVILALAGAAMGLLIALWVTGSFAAMPGLELPRAAEVAVDGRALLFAIASAVLSAIGFGLAPAFRATRTDLNETLKEGARGSDIADGKVRGALIIGEVAIALLLLVGAGLLMNSFYRRAMVPPGFDPKNALALQVSLPAKKYADGKARGAFYRSALAKIEALPGVESAGSIVMLPLAEYPGNILFSVPGRTYPPDKTPFVDFDFCSPHYFSAMKIPLVKGRTFEDADDITGRKVVVVSEALVKQHFPNEDPIGKMIRLDSADNVKADLFEIVGVVGDVRKHGLGERLEPCAYRTPSQGWMEDGRLVIRTKGAPAAMTEAVRRAIASVDGELPVARVRTMEDILRGSLAEERVLMGLIGAFAAAAVLLAVIGLYGVIAYAVSQRTREIGIRMALGADRLNVVGMILRQGMKLVCVGVVLGLVGGVASTRVLQKLLYEITPTDPVTFAAVAGVLMLVAMVACLFPARRAARIEPMVALRNE